MNRRLFLGGFIPAPAWSAAAIRLSRTDGMPEYVDVKEYRATVIVFLSTVCPISNAYQERIRALAKHFEDKAVRLLLVNANDNESAAETERYAADVKFPVPFFKDWRNTVADRFGVTLTPEVVVIDASGAPRYQGAIDDSRNPARVKVEAVKIAVDDLLAGRPVSIKSIRAFGCAIKKV
ncbi:MAG: redoxin domain-containing protein [Acidobacteria bacterium]|nr:redoxin domain-containing protein [Acidobacteriota bacterium]